MCDRCILNLIRPYLLQVDDNHHPSSTLQFLLQLFKSVLSQESIISLTADVQIQFITQRAAELLALYFPAHPSHTLPECLNHWVRYQILELKFSQDSHDLALSCSPLHIERMEHQLTICLVPNLAIDQYLLVLNEQELPSFSVKALEILGLTQREAEVLWWVAQDKSNAGIAKILGCCNGTVRKHLENIYKKLGVQTRTGAVMATLERLGVLKDGSIAKST
jgi:DNA-binding CsgD family transcriptional regulator